MTTAQSNFRRSTVTRLLVHGLELSQASNFQSWQRSSKNCRTVRLIGVRSLYQSHRSPHADDSRSIICTASQRNAVKFPETVKYGRGIVLWPTNRPLSQPGPGRCKKLNLDNGLRTIFEELMPFVIDRTIFHFQRAPRRFDQW